MSKWMIYAKKADFRGISKKFGISPVTARVIRNRDVEDEEDIRKYLRGTMADLDDAELLPGLKDAAFVLKRKIVGGERIRIIGDYDVDGICCGAIMMVGLRALGYEDHASVRLPKRFSEGYGVSETAIDE